MELGTKIKILRQKAGLTQEMLANELGVSFQSVSKWENHICAPDIMLLPKLSVFFGVTIDELFDLTKEQRLQRIEKMLYMETEISQESFSENVKFLEEQLEECEDKGRIYSLLAHLYYHRICSDSDLAGMYAKKAMQLNPNVGDGWMLQKTEGAAIRDWNIRNHHKTILFYKDLIEKYPDVAENYLDLIDNLLEDNRTVEARAYLEKYKMLDESEAVRVMAMEIRITVKEHNLLLAEQKLKELEDAFPEDNYAVFVIADYYAADCQYEKALAYYEKAFSLAKKPRYVDELQGMATIYAILGKYEEAVKCYDRMFQTWDREFGMNEGMAVQRAKMEKQHLLEMMIK